jgi:hypothetical protein
MGVYKLSTAGGLATPRTNYSSFLAGNPAVQFTSYESISTVTVGSGGSASITFSSIPATYTHLQIRAIQRATAGSFQNIKIVVNGDTGTNYSYHLIEGDGSSATAGADSSTATALIAQEPGSTQNASVYGVFVMDLLDYANTNKYKTIRNLSGVDNNGTGKMQLWSSLWQSSSAITSIVFSSASSNNFAQYTQFALYGIKGA